MKRTFYFSLCLVVLVAFANWGIASAPVQTGGAGTWPFEVDDTGGPDDYGYIWIDSNEPGGPAVNFIDISSFGTEVSGLGDDNVVGPFPIGFDFHYYWYDVDQFWLGSNGWIKFSTGGMLAADFPPIPNAGLPNDIICPFTSDLYFDATAPSRAYYWSNNVDSCIISWNNVQAWLPSSQGGPSGSHTFEIILSAADSNITFQIDAQSGTFYSNTAVVGIENATGQIGLQVMYNQLPQANTAYLFDYPDEVTYQAHDMAVGAVMNENSKGMFILTDTDTEIWCMIKNAGNQNETDCSVTAEILNSSGQVQWTENQNLGAMTIGEEREITFGTTWSTNTAGAYQVRVEVNMTGDINPTNDVYDCDLEVVTIPGELGYDDNNYEHGWGWAGGNGGMGVRFAPPVYPAEITQVKFFYTGTTSISHELKIIDDDGENGAPGTDLYTEAISPLENFTWLNYDIDPPVVISDGCFYLALIQTEESNSFAMDTSGTDPESRQTWEFTGVWAPFRYEANHEFMIRCTFDAETSAVALVDPVVASYTLLENYPNPFNPTTTIRYNMPNPGNVTLKVFDINGRLVNTLVNGQNPQGTHRIIWDGTDVYGNKMSSGIYFYQIDTPYQHETAKMVLIK